MHYRRHCSQGAERGITWSKCTRTRRCQSLRKSAKTSCQYGRILYVDMVLTVVLNLLVVLDRHLGGELQGDSSSSSGG